MVGKWGSARRKGRKPVGVIEQVTAVISPVVTVGRSVEKSQASPPEELVIHQLPPVIGSHPLQGTLAFLPASSSSSVRKRKLSGKEP